MDQVEFLAFFRFRNMGWGVGVLFSTQPKYDSESANPRLLFRVSNVNTNTTPMSILREKREHDNLKGYRGD
jgi:hypothetical protein